MSSPDGTTGQPDPNAATAAEPAPASGTVELEAARKDLLAAQDRYLRIAADLENFRRRTIREKEELQKFAAAKVLESLLPVWDNLTLAMGAARQANADVKTLVGGVEMVLQQFKSALSEHGLVEINPVGRPFDPHQQEAISHQPSSNVAAEHVLTVVRPGFMLNGRLLRPASVVVSSGPDKG